MSERVGDGSPAEAGARTYSAPALEKGLDILELLSCREGGLSQREIARELGRSVGEIYRMLNCLVDRNYVALNDEVYTLTTKLYELAHRHPPTERLIVEAAPLMRGLADRLQQACHLTVFGSGKQIVIAKQDAPDGIGFAVQVGAQIAVPQSASGQVLVAFQSVEVRRARLDECMAGRPGEERAAFEALLEEVVRKGFASLESRQYRGVQAVSFPVLDSMHNALAALTVPYLERLDIDDRTRLVDVERELAEAARCLTARMGGRALAAAA
ncbi:IclR family transcriptional regulator [Aureimonas populi]|uniref:IclR family transcriptional regulator n=1 Tax=Aureimonas populi TaxID=1701758 RepID=A0ABW5CTD0_9HYPH|nr:IclR family transcriptional regulator [Aureimonas populi]